MDHRLRQAYTHYRGQWPYDELPSGVMFWQGLKITIEDFINFARDERSQPESRSGKIGKMSDADFMSQMGL